MNNYTTEIEALEPALEAIVDLCNNSDSLSNEPAVIAAEAALERVYQSRKDKDIAALEKIHAAAPMLLDALQRVVAMWDHHTDAHGDGVASPLHEAARSAIAAATN